MTRTLRAFLLLLFALLCVSPFAATAGTCIGRYIYCSELGWEDCPGHYYVIPSFDWVIEAETIPCGRVCAYKYLKYRCRNNYIRGYYVCEYQFYDFERPMCCLEDYSNECQPT